QFLIAQSNAVLTKPQDVQANLTTAFDSIMNPKVLLGSAIDQIRNSTARSVSGNNETAADKATISVIDPRILILSYQIIPPKAISKDSNVPNIPRSEGVGPAVRAGNLTITYIELFNPTDNRVVFPSTASLSISDILLTSLQQPDHAISATRVNQTSPGINETTPVNSTTVINEKPTENTPNQLTRAGISPAI